MTAATYAATRGQKVSDLVKGDLDALKRFDMSADDKNKLNAWEALLNSAGDGDDGVEPVHVGAGHHAGGDVGERHQGGLGGRGQRRRALEHGHQRSRRGGHVFGDGGALGGLQLQPGDLPEVPAELLLQGPGDHRRVAQPVAPALQRQHVGDVRRGRPHRSCETIDKYYAHEVRQAGRHARRDHEPRRVDAARQHRHGLVQRDVGRQRPQPEQPADHPGRQLRGLLQGRPDDQLDTATASTGATATVWQGNSESQCADGSATGSGQRPHPADRDHRDRRPTPRSTSTSTTS